MSTEKTAEKASDRAERLLIERMLAGAYPPGSDLPGERDLCKELGVARPALREALQRLARDGWLLIQQGRSTQVSDFMRDGNINVLTALLNVDLTLLPGFVPNLLDIWCLMAPAYTESAVNTAPQAIAKLLFGFQGLADRPKPFTRAQWRLHQAMIEHCGNPVYGLILNNFHEFYTRLALFYFRDPVLRAGTRDFWHNLYIAARNGDARKARQLVHTYMTAIRDGWSYLDIEDWLATSGGEIDDLMVNTGDD